MLLVIPDTARGAKDGYIGISSSRRWPRFGETRDDRLFIRNVGSYKLCELRRSLSEISPRGCSDIQDTDVLRIFPPGYEVIYDPPSQET